ncbi:MAG: type II toxin-antitoxin system RelE/ParE family toxin [Clostridia bacterium]|nr:type II toxin-antitoxin system RelE/ParE family toxin [Clostridia bacterium]MBO5020389.1 type II toxin-antitoxin system RelE/ParE family toxin [Clostridia bacterium]
MRKIFVTPNVKKFMEQADDKTRAKIDSVLLYLTDDKNPLREPYVKHIAMSKYKELYELRIKASGEMSRVIFTLLEDDMVLLYAFKKKCDRDNEKAFERAFKIKKLSEELTEVCI